MYEASFGLKRRPFSATPDATCFLSSEPIRAALDEIAICVEHGQGIAVLTAPAGTGKTLLCERLRCELDERYETAFLRHSSFLTRRALLQTILSELNAPYHHASEQELRLELLPAIRALQPNREALVLICDEAHQLTDSLLEELRILADFAEAGRPLVRLVLVGQLSLEEKLAQPSLEAFNQRIRAHVNLSTFDHAGSLDYIDYRLTWAGGRSDEIFTPEALDLIARVSDGVPRCINQLADHTLLLAFVAEQRPAGEELVREALNDLRQLPLHWNEPPQSFSLDRSGLAEVRDESPRHSVETEQDFTDSLETVTSPTTYSYEPDSPIEQDSAHEDHVEEIASTTPHLVSHDDPLLAAEIASEFNIPDVGGDDWRQTLELFDSHFHPETLGYNHSLNTAQGINEPSNQPSAKLDEVAQLHDVLQQTYEIAAPLATAVAETRAVTQQPSIAITNPSDSPAKVNQSTLVSGFQEEEVLDRYAAIDAGLEPPVIPQTDTATPAEVHSERLQVNPLPVVSPVVSNSAASYEPASNSGDHGEAEESVCEGTFTIYANGPTSLPHAFEIHETSRHEQSVEGRFTLAPPVHDAVSRDESSESLLRSIQKDVDDLSTSVGQTSLPYSMSDELPDASWEAIETPPANSKPENRPFRYLFSKLRRKQQGLS